MANFLSSALQRARAAISGVGLAPVLDSAERTLRRDYRLQRALQTQLSGADVRTAGLETAYAEPILQMVAGLPGFGPVHETQLLLWHAMRQYSPTLDAAIRNRRTLEGEAYATSDDEGLAEMLNDFIRTVPVGYLAGRATERGLNSYVNRLADNADEYGLAAGEIVLDPRGREIRRLVAPNVRTLSLRDADGDERYELYQAQQGQRRRIDDTPMVQVFSLSYATDGPWPAPMAWSAVKSTEVALRMFEAMANAWWRFGDPSLLLAIEYDAEAEPDMVEAVDEDGNPIQDVSGSSLQAPAELLQLKQGFEAVMRARQQGKVGDLYASVKGGQIKAGALGSVDASMAEFFREHASVFDSHVVALSRTPIWMYPHLTPGRSEGLGSSLSNNEALIAAIDARKRNEAKRRIIREVIDTFLVVSGEARFLGQYRVEFDEVAILDDEAEGKARKALAEADMQVIDNAVQLYDEAGSRRFAGEAERYLTEQGIYSDPNE